ncbi:isocitrate lyase/phosphoenolpyruvate mutase family protein [Nocardiopsis sp. CNT-189]|uniref:isocitrate lyase/PEP mutase family protein n=1 Tax=Nocardiopsis oceanisediminis TaxID=2816862 RepID=UPI003B2BE692
MDRFAEFRALHRPGDPFVLPNAWDLASAAALAAAGFRAIGTTSLGVAAAAGKPDAEGATRAETVRSARGMAWLDALVTVDVEGGFGEGPEGVGALAAELAAAGAAGINLEDGRGTGLADPAEQCALIRAVKEAAPALFVNARTDTHWLPGAGHAEQTLDRALAYQDAGADGLFVPGLPGAAGVEALAGRVGLPLNVLHRPGGPSLRALAEAGAARVSSGSLPFRAAIGAAVRAARGIAADRPVPDGPPPSYAEAQALAGLYRAGRDRTGGSGPRSGIVGA